MNAPVAPPAFPSARCRRDGWTLDRRRLFLEALAEGHLVEHACTRVGMSKVSAYKLRRRDPGFARAWSTALEPACSDRLLDPPNPAILDRIKTVVRRNGTIVRRLDNRRALVELLRLDRQIARLEVAAAHKVAQKSNGLSDDGPDDGADA